MTFKNVSVKVVASIQSCIIYSIFLLGWESVEQTS